MAQKPPKKCLAALTVFESILTSTPPPILRQVIRSAYSLVPTLTQLQSQVSVQAWESTVVRQYQVGPWWHPLAVASKMPFCAQELSALVGVVHPFNVAPVACLGMATTCTQHCTCEHISVEAIDLLPTAWHEPPQIRIAVQDSEAYQLWFAKG